MRSAGRWALLCLLPAAGLAAPQVAAPAPPGKVAAATAAPNGYDWRLTVRGRLANGLRYAVLPRQGTEPGVGMFMRVAGGFIAERRSGERGLAHLIEHVAFYRILVNAPPERRYGRGTTVPLTFPAPSAGATSWSDTTYYLSSRRTDPTDIDKLLAMFRDVAGNVVFTADDVDRQRADVMREMGEKRRGNAIYARYIAAIAPGSPNDLIDGQNSDDVPTADIATIRALYHRLYRPERTEIVIVGAVDPAAMATLIRQRFGDWHSTGPTPAPPRPPTFRADRITPISYSATDDRLGVTVSVTMPPLALPRTPALRMQAMLMELIAVQAVNDRLARAQPNSAPGKVGAVIEDAGDGFRMIRLLDHVSPGQWASGIAALKRTTCDVTARGWSRVEWGEAKRGVIDDLAARSRAMAATRNIDLANELARAMATRRELIAPDTLLAYARAWLPGVDERTGSRWWASQWRAGVEHIRVETPELARIEDPTAAIRAALDTAKVGCAVRRG